MVQLGCGITGLVCAELLESNEDVNEIVLADIDPDPAKEMTKRVKSDKFSVTQVDARDRQALRKLFRGKDLVVCALPGELNVPVMEAAISSGLNYLDFSMSNESIKHFVKIHRMFKDADLTAIHAMGCDSGLSDIMAKHAIGKLDSATEAYIRDGEISKIDGRDFVITWSPLEMMEEVTTPAPIFRHGEFIHLPPLHKREIYNFPEPVGPLPVYNTNHEETRLMPRFIRGLEKADFKISVNDNLAAAANMLRKLGMHSFEPVDVDGVRVRPIDVVTALIPRPIETIGKVKGYSCIVAEVIGMRDGKKTMLKEWIIMSHERAYELCRSNAVGYLVGVGGAIGAELLLSGKVRQRGIVAPEHLPTDYVIDRLPDFEIPVHEETTLL
ncbi:MAG: hypothetical protein A3K76_02635 [Euryarchaeota archaeon RBG_13_57_23]|nr:MAG: hypothetical protein A3K76_02635 [Euryarchaeota archaeon RBG_13_57_23]